MGSQENRPICGAPDCDLVIVKCAQPSASPLIELMGLWRRHMRNFLTMHPLNTLTLSCPRQSGSYQYESIQSRRTHLVGWIMTVEVPERGAPARRAASLRRGISDLNVLPPVLIQQPIWRQLPKWAEHSLDVAASRSQFWLNMAVMFRSQRMSMPLVPALVSVI